MNTLSSPLLTCLVLAPLAGSVLLGLLPQRSLRFATAASLLLSLLLSSVAFFGYDAQGEAYQWVVDVPWLPLLGVHWLLAVDGLSVLFLPATALLFLGALVTAWTVDPAARRLYYASLLALQGCLFGIFCAFDLVLFFVFWEASLLPVYFLLARGGVSAQAAAVAGRYVLIMLAAGLPLLLAVLWLGQLGGFDLRQLLAMPLAVDVQRGVFLLFLLAFAVKVPLVPLHTWLPQLALAAPGTLTALLLGLKVGVYALLRLALPLAPAAAAEWHWLLAGLGGVSLLYGAVGILSHSNLRVSLAYASICHVGLAVMGLATLSAAGVQGAVSLLLSFSVASGGVLLLLECLRQRTGTTDVHALGGVAQTMPLLAGGVLMCGLAGVGLPGTSSFPGEFMLILAVLERYTGAGMAALFGLAIAAGAFLAQYRQAFWGPLRSPAVQQASDLLPRERWLLFALIAMIVGIGLYPAPWIDTLGPSAQAWAAAMQRSL
jgi:NADH-quinone oxidoreductase subunit M